MIDQGRRNLLGVAISAVDYEYAVAKIIAHAREGRRCATTALAVHGVITAALDRAHRYRLNTLRPRHSRRPAGAVGIEPALWNEAERPGVWTGHDAEGLQGGRVAGNPGLLLWKQPASAG